MSGKGMAFRREVADSLRGNAGSKSEASVPTHGLSKTLSLRRLPCSGGSAGALAGLLPSAEPPVPAAHRRPGRPQLETLCCPEVWAQAPVPAGGPCLRGRCSGFAGGTQSVSPRLDTPGWATSDRPGGVTCFVDVLACCDGSPPGEVWRWPIPPVNHVRGGRPRPEGHEVARRPMGLRAWGCPVESRRGGGRHGVGGHSLARGDVGCRPQHASTGRLDGVSFDEGCCGSHSVDEKTEAQKDRGSGCRRP